MLNVTKVIRGAREWPSDVGKFFQPNRNTRFSAVILWSTDYFVGDPTLRFTWDLIPNPHALVPLSNSIREALRRPQS
jgi:hypothetical protein